MVSVASAQVTPLKQVEVNLLMEPGSNVPSWYRGAPLPTLESKTRVSAFIFLNGKKLPPGNFTYSWTIDGNLDRIASGKGKESISYAFPKSKGSASAIQVEVLDTKNKLRGKGEILINPRIPEVLIYEKSSSGPITARAIKNKTMGPGSKFEIKAVPFFMNASSFENLNFRWNFDGLEIPADPTEPNVFLVKSNSGSSGSALLNLIVNNLKSVLEEARASLNIYAQ